MRIAIVGNSGSGKTTLARRLIGDKQASVLDLDTIAWEPDQIAVARPAAAAEEDVRAFCKAHGSWVIEGCYAGLIEVSLAFNPHLLFLEPGLNQCVANCLARPWEPHKYASREEQDDKLAFLLDWIEAYYSREGDMSLKAHRALFENYAGPKHRLSTLPERNSTGLSHLQNPGPESGVER